MPITSLATAQAQNRARPRVGSDAMVAAMLLAAHLRPARGRAAPARLASTVVSQRVPARPAPSSTGRSRKLQSASPTKRPRDIQLSQFYTHPAIAGLMAEISREHFNLDHVQTVEPSAGDGAFLPFLPVDRLAFDTEPKDGGIVAADFLDITVSSDLPIVMIGNPPFGKNSNLAKAFFNHAASQSLVIAMILPRTFRKASIQNALNLNFHLFREVDVPDDAFLFRSEKRTVPAVFQIWIRSDRLRALWWTERTHRDFAFVDRADKDFAIRRIGVNAGRLYRNTKGKDKSFYFIKGDVWDVMSTLDFQAIARDTAGIPSLSMAEIVGLYDERIRLNRSACEA